MSNCVIYGQNPLKLDKIGHISVRDFASACINIFIINFAIFDFLMKTSGSKLNFYLILLWEFSIFVSRKNLAAKFFCETKMKNPNILE